MPRIENVIFFRATGGLDKNNENGKNAEKISSSAPKRVKYAVTLAAFKSVAITPFSFPFNNAPRVREALKLQTLPYAAAGEMELFPCIIEKTPRSGSGVTLYVPSGELEVFSFSAPLPGVENRVWPAPLPLVSKVGGEGVTFWLDEENICSMLWRGRVPVLYRWKPRAASSPDAELAWYETYCKSKGEEVGEVFVMDAAAPLELARFEGIALESAALCPWISGVNISRSALDTAVVLERTVRSLSKAAAWVLAIGLVVLAGNALRFYEARRSLAALRGRTAELYRSAFEPSRTGPVSDPLGLARFTVARLKGASSEGRPLDGMLSDLGAIFEQHPNMDVTLEAARYNAEGVDCTGSAPDMETVQEFRRAWAEKAASAQLGNLNTVPGGTGYRFDLYVKW